MTNHRNHRNCLVVAFLSTVLLSPVGAQEPAEPPASSNPGTASFEGNLVDQGNTAAKELAAASGISVGEATRRLRLMRQAGNAAHRNAKNGADSLLRPIVKDGGVVFPRDVSDATSTESGIQAQFDTDLRPSVSMVATKRPVGQLKAEVARLSKDLGTPEGVTGIRVSVLDGTLEILSTEVAKTNEALKVKAITLPDFVTVVQSEPIVLSDTGTAGMTAGLEASSSTCRSGTWGFMAYENGDILKPGLLTAAHTTRNNALTQLRLGQTSAATNCGTGTSWQTRRLDWRGGAFTDRMGIDIAFHRQTSGTNYSPFFFNGSANVRVTDVLYPAAGTRVCKYGVKTGKTCGVIETDFVWSNGYGFMSSVLVDASYPLSADLGDSGGPVWFGTNTAVGIEHAQWSTRKFLYSELQALIVHSTGLTIAN